MNTFRCGHEKSPENRRFTKGFFQCRTCEESRRRERRARAKRFAQMGEIAPVPGHNMSNYHHLGGAAAIFANDGGAEDIQRGSISLLRALHRSYPYVFDAAERAGRMAVRP
ncbi:hypothetical protein [Novosphingobium sp. RL4]|uniref:hypothetical protein n=1 Tax=Novosphingobium sp. RL4 TaxID=3109595 RepID=UPI002D79F6C0|nr:hypothetical protein [Novosphingobium sp. RL4]WRT91896.1 hypothetical protein U9J33_11805 [Novosphingobium sp. RL4]